ncbi:hypothetical protein J6590_010979 [Homalodisca vitripennis]|nr:hypothetical protein J6590_010979 [Homalodisca vitripennis]
MYTSNTIPGRPFESGHNNAGSCCKNVDAKLKASPSRILKLNNSKRLRELQRLKRQVVTSHACTPPPSSSPQSRTQRAGISLAPKFHVEGYSETPKVRLM